MSVRWIAYVWESSPFKGERLLLHLALADFANDEGECWPSQPTLARKARCSVTWVRLGLRDLKTEGLLEVVSEGSGRGNRTQYRLLRKGVTTNGVSEKGESPAPERVHSAHSDTTYRNRKEPSNTHAVSFDRFWQAYPRRVARGAALTVWSRVMSKPDAPTIDAVLAAVAAYERSVSDPKFICHPATWLRQERWLDHIAQESVSVPVVRDRWQGEKRNSEDTICALVRAGKSEGDIVDFIHGRPTEVQEHLVEFLAEFRRSIATGK